MNRLKKVLISYLLIVSFLLFSSCSMVRKIDNETQPSEEVSNVINNSDETEEKTPETTHVEDETTDLVPGTTDLNTDTDTDNVYETTYIKVTHIETNSGETSEKLPVEIETPVETEIKVPETTRVSTTTLEEQTEPFRPWLEIGKCKKLEGKVDVRLFFIDDDASSWDENTVNIFTDTQIDAALDFLETQADIWGIELEFTTESYATYLNEGYEMRYKGTVNNNLDKAPSTKDVLDQAAICLGYKSKEDMHSSFISQNGGKEIVYLTFLNEDGTSYTRNQIKKGIDYVEHCVIFAANIYQPNIIIGHTMRAVAIAHEILHLFGAQDYYTPDIRRSIAEELYLKDIMLEEYRSISALEIGDLTAYSIGWTDEIPEVCYNDDWWAE